MDMSKEGQEGGNEIMMEDLKGHKSDDETSRKDVSERKVAVKGKIFNDPIHGTIEMHPACVCIIDTPEFQRLRHIKQLDTCYFVYPGASHNRFEHSIGVSYLAGKLLRAIREHQRLEEITDRDILCVEIAGLCHDLGRGPFSYVFEKLFMKQTKKDYKHRKIAKQMFEYMLNEKGLKTKIQESIEDCKVPGFTGFKEDDFTFIKEMIDQQPKHLETMPWPYKGRGENKSYMYEIVNNKRNGIDVDKWDYLARDSYMLGVKTNFDYNRCFASARVLKSNGSMNADDIDGNRKPNTGESKSSETKTVYKRKQICYRDKDAQGLYDMFYTKMLLTRQAYQHKTNVAIRLMMLDVLNSANENIRFNGKKISETVNDMKAFTQLTDDIILLILHPPTSVRITDPSYEKGLNNAKKCMELILKRKVYKLVGQTQKKEEKIDEKTCKEEILQIMQENDEHSIVVNLFHIYIVNLHYGERNKDPLQKVRFYRKTDKNHPIKLEKDQVSYVLPATFDEQIIRIYSKVPENDTLFLRIGIAFGKWCERKGLPLPKNLNRENRDESTQAQQQGEVLTNNPLVEPNLLPGGQEQTQG